MKRAEFSKKILAVVGGAAAFVTLFACALMWKTGDSGALAYLIPAVFGELATATGFYYSKARAENEIKLRNKGGNCDD